ncbi:MAG: cupin domain-containing protein [Ignavibacteriaceae bacterium]
MNENNQQISTSPHIPINNFKNNTEYQPESTIIKMILKKSNGNVVLFAFDKEQGLIEHAASSDALVFIIEGEIEFTISGEKYLLKEGDTFTLPAKIPHSLYALKQTKMFLIIISD